LTQGGALNLALLAANLAESAGASAISHALRAEIYACAGIRCRLCMPKWIRRIISGYFFRRAKLVKNWKWIIIFYWQKARHKKSTIGGHSNEFTPMAFPSVGPSIFGRSPENWGNPTRNWGTKNTKFSILQFGTITLAHWREFFPNKYQ